MPNKVIDLNEHKEEREALSRELISYGIMPTEHVGVFDLREMVRKIRQERAGKPPCYRRSFAQTAMQCRICDLRFDCARPAKVASYVPAEEMHVEQCKTCESGVLTRELTDEDTGAIRDYGCTTEGCLNTLVAQDHFDPDAAVELPSLPRFESDVKPFAVTIWEGRKDFEIDDAILASVAKREIVTSKKGIRELVGGNRARLNRRVDFLVRDGQLTFKKGTGYIVPKKKKKKKEEEKKDD